MLCILYLSLTYCTLTVLNEIVYYSVLYSANDICNIVNTNVNVVDCLEK